jgi:hypothetical protein
VTHFLFYLFFAAAAPTIVRGERAESKAWSRSRLGQAGDGARELLPWMVGPGDQRNFDPEHPLGGL